MRKRTMIIGAVVILLAIVSGMWIYQNGGLQALLFGNAETEIKTAAETTLPAVETVECIIADEVIVPACDATLSVPTAGIVADVLVGEGDYVNITRDEAGRRSAQGPEAAARTVADVRQSEVDQIFTDEWGLEVDFPATSSYRGLATVQTVDLNLNVRAGPGTDYIIVGYATPGEALAVVGRNSAQTWVLVEQGHVRPGWVAAEFVTTDQPITEIPVTDYVQDAPVPFASDPVISDAPAIAPDQVVAGLDGTLVFQSSNGGVIYTYDLAQNALRSLTNGFDPAISPDGQTVAFTRNGGEQGLYLINIDGSSEHRIYAGGERLRAPSWSPNGAWIVFSHLTGDYACREIGLGLCYPDSRQLEGFPLIHKEEFGLSKVNIDGEEFRDIAALNTAVSPDWTEAGIIYQSASGLQRTADKPDAEDEALVQDHFCQDPTWQPGGNRIAFQRQEGSHREIYTINSDGGDLQALTRPPDLLARVFPQSVAPDWSPDGQHIAFLSNRNSDGSIGNWSIWVMDADGHNQQRLPIDVDINYSFQNEQVLSW